jgi:hypothetical protein
MKTKKTENSYLENLQEMRDEDSSYQKKIDEYFFGNEKKKERKKRKKIKYKDPEDMWM